MSTQTDLFEKISERSERRQNALENLIIADNLHDNQGTPRPAAYSEWKKDVEVLQGPTRNGLFDISDEILKLKEIKDIMDELSMIEDVLKQQRRALEMLEDLPYEEGIYRPSKLLARLERRKNNIESLRKDASQVYNSVCCFPGLPIAPAN
jgi:hypothetical protein